MKIEEEELVQLILEKNHQKLLTILSKMLLSVTNY